MGLEDQNDDNLDRDYGNQGVQPDPLRGRTLLESAKLSDAAKLPREEDSSVAEPQPRTAERYKTNINPEGVSPAAAATEGVVVDSTQHTSAKEQVVREEKQSKRQGTINYQKRINEAVS